MVEDRSQLRGRLQARLEQLTRRAGQIEADLRRPAEQDSEERAVERENDEVLQTLDDSTLSEVNEIRAALGRLDDGTYGACARCGQPIDSTRLAALPYAVTCIDCASS